MSVQYLMMTLVAVIVVFLVGCTAQHLSYITHAQTVHPMVIPVDIKFKTSKNYYPVPNDSTSIMTITPPSLVPPGSNLQRFNHRNQYD
ncbi:hypothetical protein [Coxiella endosymbiont of Amblyomma nuttalli]|uniref:hypothetical protein n=1 Tax=Coxiella endosymbiont of Amblyomma nuttalli TaxID=2749996 RepID=UPI001BAA9FF6|nr:hypothetical protein [Coxiella endosymbiont of Amblyomma nuttalli]QTS83915.1 hypothetical protein CEAn_00394 [Coxiella endosymbiont of Amblyomma nuttalli]